MQEGLVGLTSASCPPWLGGRAWAATGSSFINKLRIPPLLTGTQRDGFKIFDLRVQSGRAEFFEGSARPTIGVNGTYLGPTIRVRAVDHVRMNVTNNLVSSTTVHWHGLHLPAKAEWRQLAA